MDCFGWDLLFIPKPQQIVPKEVADGSESFEVGRDPKDLPRMVTPPQTIFRPAQVLYNWYLFWRRQGLVPVVLYRSEDEVCWVDHRESHSKLPQPTQRVAEDIMKTMGLDSNLAGPEQVWNVHRAIFKQESHSSKPPVTDNPLYTVFGNSLASVRKEYKDRLTDIALICALAISQSL